MSLFIDWKMATELHVELLAWYAIDTVIMQNIIPLPKKSHSYSLPHLNWWRPNINKPINQHQAKLKNIKHNSSLVSPQIKQEKFFFLTSPLLDTLGMAITQDSMY